MQFHPSSQLEYFFLDSTDDNEFYYLWADLKIDKNHISIQDQSVVFIGIQFFLRGEFDSQSLTQGTMMQDVINYSYAPNAY